MQDLRKTGRESGKRLRWRVIFPVSIFKRGGCGERRLKEIAVMLMAFRKEYLEIEITESGVYG